MERPRFRAPTVYLTSFRDEKTNSLLAELQGKPPNRKFSLVLWTALKYATASSLFVYLRVSNVYVCACVMVICVRLKVPLVRHVVF